MGINFWFLGNSTTRSFSIWNHISAESRGGNSGTSVNHVQEICSILRFSLPLGVTDQRNSQLCGIQRLSVIKWPSSNSKFRRSAKQQSTGVRILRLRKDQQNLKLRSAWSNLTRFLVDDRSSCNVLYADILELLGLQRMDLNPYYVGDLLAFNDSITRPWGTTYMTWAIGEATYERKVILSFHVISCKSVFRDILERSFLERLNVVASSVHLKGTYHYREGMSGIFGVDLKEANRIQKLIQREVLTIMSGARGNSGYTNTFNMDACEDEVRPTPNGEFEFIQLGDNYAWSVKIGFGLPLEVRATLIECLRENTNIFTISL